MNMLTVNMSTVGSDQWRIKITGAVVDATGKPKENKFGHDNFGVDVFSYPVAGDPFGNSGKTMTSAVTQLMHKLYSGTTASLDSRSGNLITDYIHRGFTSTNGQRSFSLPLDDLIKSISKETFINVIPTADGFYISDKAGHKQAKCDDAARAPGLADYLVKQTQPKLAELGVTQTEAINIIAQRLSDLDLDQPQQFSKAWIESAIKYPESRARSAPINAELAKSLGVIVPPQIGSTKAAAQSSAVYGSRKTPGPPMYTGNRSNNVGKSGLSA